jgi:hypothetical protein
VATTCGGLVRREGRSALREQTVRCVRAGTESQHRGETHIVRT